MVESIGNEAVVNAKPEDTHGITESNVANDVVMAESDVRTSVGEMMIDDSKDKPVMCSEVDQNMSTDPADNGLSLSEKSLADDREDDGKVKMDEIAQDGSEELSVCNSMNDFVHGQEVRGKKIEATELKNVSPVSTGDGSIPAEDVEIGKNDTLKGNITCIEHESVSARSMEAVERNGGTQASLDSEVDMTIRDSKRSSGLTPMHEDSVMMPPNNICSTVAYATNTNAMLSNPGNVQGNTNGFASSGNDFSDPGKQIGQNVESEGKLCEQANETICSHVVDFVATASRQSVEPSELIESSKGHAVQEQGYSNDTEMVDSGEVKEVPDEFTPEISLSMSEDDDEQIGSGSYLQGKASDSENERVTDAGKSLHRERKNANRVASRLGSLAKESRATYELPLETADELSVYDLVWGKVKSHPWWPGQIFDPSDSSEKAMKYHKKDCYLVAYFGDKTFAWNEASQLKPFRAHFSQAEKQNSSESFQNAIDCALEEVSRRAELGLACSCMPKETYDKIKFQIVENAGIQTGSCKKEGGDGYISAESFQPDKLVNYVRNLAHLSTYGANQLELTIAKAQLLSFYRLKDGRQMLPEVQFFEGLLENEFDTSFPQVSNLPSESEPPDKVAAADVSCTVKSKGPKRKHNLKDIVYHRRKEKSFSEIMGESLYYYDEDYDSDEKVDGMLNSPTVGRKRKASNFLDDEPKVPESTRTISLAKVSKTATPSPRQSFKIGDCIRRVASQLTGSSSTVKSTDDGNNQQVEHDTDKPLDAPEDTQNEIMVISTEETSPDGFLLQLYLTAQDPVKAHEFSKSVVSYFSEFRDAAVSAMRKSKQKNSSARGGSGRKRKSSLSLGVAPEEFEYHDRKDSYWAHMVVENNSEEKQPARRGRKRKERQLGAEESEKPKKSIQRRRPRKQKVNGNHELIVEQSSADEEKYELPTELLLNFGDNSTVPSVADLNRMFRRFGPLKTSETEADKQSSRARVVFKNGSDAEIAYSSAATFNIFGSATVSYQLIQTPPVSSHTSTLPLAQCTTLPLAQCTTLPLAQCTEDAA